MWIRMISTAAGPRLPHAFISEHTYEVSDELGQEFIAVRAAEEIPTPGAPEAAVAQAGETAVTPAPDRKASLMSKLSGEAQADAAASDENDAAEQAPAADTKSKPGGKSATAKQK